MQSGSHPIPLHEGNLFAKRYLIERHLGQGGMGDVFLASDSVLEGERIALKVLLASLGKDERHVKRFLREVQLTRKVTDAHVVRTFDAGIDSSQLYFTMEFIDGQSLKEILSQGALAPAQIVAALRSIAHGLDAIHQAGIVHRDLKPGNVLLGRDGSLKIADFGVARPGSSDLTAEQELVGSTPFIAPEIWLGREAVAASDYYSLGIIAYEMATGVPPICAESTAEYMGKHLTATLPLAHTLNDEIPLPLSELIAALLHKKPEERPSRADDFEHWFSQLQTDSAASQGPACGVAIDPFELPPTATHKAEEITVLHHHDIPFPREASATATPLRSITTHILNALLSCDRQQILRVVLTLIRNVAIVLLFGIVLKMGLPPLFGALLSVFSKTSSIGVVLILSLSFLNAALFFSLPLLFLLMGIRPFRRALWVWASCGFLVALFLPMAANFQLTAMISLRDELLQGLWKGTFPLIETMRGSLKH